MMRINAKIARGIWPVHQSATLNTSPVFANGITGSSQEKETLLQKRKDAKIRLLLKTI
jgi:hypothetical protein